MDPCLSARIERRFSRTRAMVWSLVLFLWLVIAYVTFKVDGMVHDSGIILALYVSALVLVIFNTASVAAMIEHYREDREQI